MRTKNAKPITRAESEHMARVKALPCSICDAPGPSDAHHIEQGLHFVTVACCFDCHRGQNGWHGTKALWNVRKMTELRALAVTVERLMSR